MSSAARIAARSGGSGAPSTTRRITSSVSSCIRGSVRSGRPGAQRATSAAASARDRRAVRLHPLAVERRQHQLALAQVLLAAREQDRARAGERLEHGRARAAAQHVRRRGVDALDRLGVGDEHHRRVRPQRAQRERLAVARGAAPQQVGRPRDPLDRLRRRRARRARAGAWPAICQRRHRPRHGRRNRSRAARCRSRWWWAGHWKRHELVERARAGDADAYAALVRGHQEIAFRTAYLITGNAADAEDAAQEGFVKAHRALRPLPRGRAAAAVAADDRRQRGAQPAPLGRPARRARAPRRGRGAPVRGGGPLPGGGAPRRRAPGGAARRARPAARGRPAGDRLPLPARAVRGGDRRGARRPARARSSRACRGRSSGCGPSWETTMR